MSCTRPVSAQSYTCPTAGIPAIRFKNFDGEPNLQLPCNKCPSCKLKKAREWALRCWHESQMHETSSNITLTYADEHLPKNRNLDHRDFQLFMKRLRKNFCRYETDDQGERVCINPISFFMCGEYGGKTHRPHFHVIIFGYYPPDPVYHRTSDAGHRYYKSETLDKYWKKGFTDLTNVSYKNAGYIARYTLKKQLPDEATQDRYIYTENGEQKTRKFEYIRMSTNPAIGRSWFLKYAEQTIRNDHVLDPNGNKIPVPRYYLDILRDEICPDSHEWLAKLRLEKAQANPDNSPDRLRQKAICTESKIQQLIRPYL